MPKKKKASKASSRSSSKIRIRRILVPIDFSEHSKNALIYAIPFSGQFRASIDLLYVVEPAIYPADFSFGQVGFPNVEEELRKRGTEELENLMKK
ncbi:MAG: uspa domain-containing protein, partial [Bacteroidetes bacterium]|nr:uspa domain-containing protein [Bacteroidota bacterium]